MKARFATGLFLISLDFELYWGVRDKRSIEQYRSNLENTREAVLALLSIFEKHKIRATWSTVGLLFHQNRDELKQYWPEIHPGYIDRNLCPYEYLRSNDDLEQELHFAAGLIETISKTPGQEIGTHTYSHFYCLEKGVSKESFRADLIQARRVGEAAGLPPKSLVFPRNQWRGDFLPILAELGIESFRGVEDHPIYSASTDQEQGLLRRGLRLLDSYLNLTGHHTFTPSDCGPHTPYNLPASRFLRPYSKKLGILDGLKRRRIVRAMRNAAQKREAFHLWWHPHNFGSDLGANLQFLESLLTEYSELNRTQQFRSVSMEELARLLESSTSG